VSFRDALSPELAKRTFDCWVRLRAQGRVPKKDDLCPLGLPPAVLPYLMLMELVAPEEFRCRLIGTEIREWYGANIVGRSMRDLIPPVAHDERAPLLRHCIEQGAPAWFAGPLLRDKEAIRGGGRLLLPVAFHGEAPDGVLLVAFLGESSLARWREDRPSVALDVRLTCPPDELP
jgi:hypothetical protein